MNICFITGIYTDYYRITVIGIRRNIMQNMNSEYNIEENYFKYK